MPGNIRVSLPFYLVDCNKLIFGTQMKAIIIMKFKTKGGSL